MPSASLWRRGRVVTEIDKVRSSLSACNSMRVSVVFPAPEGEDRISMSPRRPVAAFCAAGVGAPPGSGVGALLQGLHSVEALVENLAKGRALLLSGGDEGIKRPGEAPTEVRMQCLRRGLILSRLRHLHHPAHGQQPVE